MLSKAESVPQAKNLLPKADFDGESGESRENEAERKEEEEAARVGEDEGGWV
ncbi:hypothetical protein L484_028049 [Morus notabilis]|uniref:Uncharacterized protein n=1 Tax=Morus notabilis TaxID=981085 RepID=W9S7T9_9ROSA|nr:hypothetical protein L484_028049 [Morus notabilis]